MTSPDDELARVLRQGAASAAGEDTELALARVRKTARVRHRRRVVARATAAVAAAGLVAGLWFATRPSDGTRIDTVNSPTQPTAITPATTSATAATSSTTVGTASTVVPGRAVPTTVSTSLAARPGASSTTPAGPSTSAVRPNPTTTAPSTPPTTFSGIGGRITVQVRNGALQLISSRPSPGYVVAETKAAATDVEVRFQGNGRETRIRVRDEGREATDPVIAATTGRRGFRTARRTHHIT